jgi:hypothetical protein
MTFEAPSTHRSTTSELETGQLMAELSVRRRYGRSSGKVELGERAPGGDPGLGEDVA